MKTLRARRAASDPSHGRWALVALRVALTAAALTIAAPAIGQTEPVVSVLADFEDASVAASVGDVRNVVAGDCMVRASVVPARGRGALAVEIAATRRETTVGIDLTFRETTRFAQADAVAAFFWLGEGQVSVGFRLRDADGALFETRSQVVRGERRWIRIAAELRPESLKPLAGEGSPRYPAHVAGLVIRTDQIGQQTLFLDELQVEHRVAPSEIVRGEFRFAQAGATAEATRLFPPGTNINVAVGLENRSRSRMLDLTVDLAWIRPDGGVLQRQSRKLNLPPSGVDFRSYQKVDFSQSLRDVGLYRLVAQVRAAGWSGPATFETSVGVAPIDKRRNRGRSTFFGIRTNLLRESELDQALEISTARDAGASLLLLDASWRRIEPKEGVLRLEPLRAALESIVRSGMAPALLLTEPPEWLPDPADPTAALTTLIRRLREQLRDRAAVVLLGADVLDALPLEARLAATDRVLAALGPAAEGLTLYPPPIPVDASRPRTDPTVLAAWADRPLAFVSRGELRLARAALAAARQQLGLAWRSSHLWLHEAAPTIGSGTPYEADAVVRYALEAATAGVGGIIWFDLRDDDTPAGQPGAQRGLVSRDFAPKAALLGYANIAGHLTGAVYAGPLANTPEQFEGGLFIAGVEQIGVVLPRPGQVLPAALFPTFDVPGALRCEDLDRRPLAIQSTRRGDVVPTVARPVLLTLETRAPQAEPQLRLAPPWLRVPATVFVGADADFTLEVDQPAQPMPRAFFQLTPPRDAAFTLSTTGTAIRGEPNETARFPVKLLPAAGGADFERQALTLRLSMDGDVVELPLDVRRLIEVRPLASGDRGDEEKYAIGRLAVADGKRASADVALHAAYRVDALLITLRIQDDRFVPVQVDAAGRTRGDDLTLGVRLDGADELLELRILASEGGPQAVPLPGTNPNLARTVRVEEGSTGSRSAGGDKRQYVVTIPAAALNVRGLNAPTRVLVAVRYVDDDADGLPVSELRWGRGLDGSRSSVDFRWLQLAP